jgi:hypothetical protein
MEQTGCSETSEHKIQMPGNHPKERIQQNSNFFAEDKEYHYVVVKLRGIFHTEPAKCKQRQPYQLLRYRFDDRDGGLKERIQTCGKMQHTQIVNIRNGLILHKK